MFVVASFHLSSPSSRRRFPTIFVSPVVVVLHYYHCSPNSMDAVMLPQCRLLHSGCIIDLPTSRPKSILWEKSPLHRASINCEQYTYPYPTDLFRELVLSYYSLKPRALEGCRERYLPIPYPKEDPVGAHIFICSHRRTPSEDYQKWHLSTNKRGVMLVVTEAS